MAPKPTDMKMYEMIKKKVMKENTTHSAYRSGMIVKKYKDEFGKKYGLNKSPYEGKKDDKKGLARWFNEEWARDNNGSIGYKKVGDVYRPRNRITKDTPTTWSELSETEIARAKREKKATGRVKRFRSATI